MSAIRHAIAVSFADGGHLSPRVQRTKRLVRALESDFGFQVERMPSPPADDVSPLGATLFRRAARRALRPLVLDPFEIPARLRMRGWTPSGRGALLIGWPFSPTYVAASHLVATGIPYVVDAGDPWVLTEPHRAPWSRRLPRRRATKAETFLWRHAAAGVVTTDRQARGLRAVFPDLHLLVRPNGYTPAAETVRPPAAGTAEHDPGELRLVQFGSVNPRKLPIGGWLSRLRRVAGLTRITFANYGSVDRPDLLRSEDRGVVIELHEPVKWDSACQVARSFDAAVVVANTNPDELPSKSIQYLTLPIPRIAVTESSDPGELGAFADQRPGFIAVRLDSEQDVPRLLGHLRRTWSEEDLKPPAADAWDSVARQVVQFVVDAWDRNRAPSGRAENQRVATAA